MSVSYKSLVAEDDGFSWDGQNHYYKEVYALEWYAAETTHRTNFAKTHTSQSSRMSILLNPAHKLTLKAAETDSVWTAIWECATKADPYKSPIYLLSNCYEVMSKKTFLYRAERYSKALENGKFVYDGTEFATDGTVSKGSLRLRISECKIERYAFRLHFVKPDSRGPISRFLLSPVHIAVNLERDKDVFLAMLLAHYGIRW